MRIGIVTVDAERRTSTRRVASAPSLAGFASQRIELLNLRAAFDAGLTVINAETWAAFGHLVETRQARRGPRCTLAHAAENDSRPISPSLKRCAPRSPPRSITHCRSVDVIVLPTLPALPITLEAARNGTPVIAMSSLIRPFNLSGHPALSLPLPIAGSPLRAGLQIVGRKGEDELVCAIAACFEAALAR